MPTLPPESQGDLTRDEIDKFLLELQFLNADGQQVAPLSREVLERLAEMNQGSSGLDLSFRDLSGQDFSGIDLTGANLQDANLSNAILSKAYLFGANLERAALTGARLDDADFTDAILYSDQLSEEQRDMIRGEPGYIDAEQWASAQSNVSGNIPPTEEASKAGPKSAGAKVPEPPTTSTRSLPGQTFATNDEFDGVDRLDMGKYARALARLVLMEESRPPLTIGVYGEWGSGKSALMRLIRDELNREKGARNLPLLVVEFNAWEHANDQGRLWMGLTQAIVTAMDTQTSHRKRFIFGIKNNLRFLWEFAKRRWPVSILGGTGLAAIVFGQAWGWTTGSPSPMTWAITGMGALFGSPSFFEGMKNGLIPALNKPASSQLSMLIKDAQDINESQSVIDLISQMIGTLEAGMPREFEGRNKPLGSWPGANPTESKGLKTVVFIDDLDRCPPDKIVDVLEGIKLILKDRQFVVFLAADTRIVSRAIEYRYRQILHSGKRRPSGELGMEYLAKIVQIPFLLPKPGKEELQNLVAGRQQTSSTATRQNGQPKAGLANVTNDVPAAKPRVTGSFSFPSFRRRRASKSAVPSDHSNSDDNWETLTLADEESRTLVDLAHQFTQNPRTYNRLGNELRLMRLLLHEGGTVDQWTGEKGRQMIKWLILCDHWPAFGQYIGLDQGLLGGETMDENNRILEVAKSPEALRLLRRRYDQADIDDLHAFLEQSPPLSLETVRELAAFTTNLTGIYE